MPVTDFDYIIVGAGSAGCVLANRLSASPEAQVLLLEAGDATVPEVAMNPATWPAAMGTAADWNYRTVPQPGLGGRVVAEPHGRMLGGSSSLNGMLYIRGHRTDFDSWAHDGAPGWRYENCVPYFQRIEDCVDDPDPALGHGGPLHLEDAQRHAPHPVTEAFLASCVATGFTATGNFNGPDADSMMGGGWFRVNVRNGRRHGAAQAYLLPVLDRPNLTVRTNAQVLRLEFDDTTSRRCVGVTYVSDGVEHTARAVREVLLSASTAESPKLLMLAGVGPAEHLRDHGIHVRTDLPGVGENLHDHAFVPVSYRRARPAPRPPQVAFEAALFFASDPGWIGPDLQLIFGPTTFDWDGSDQPNGFTVVSALVRPMSRGTVRLADTDPLAAPLLDPGFLTAASDVRRLGHALETTRRLFATGPLADWVDGEISPGTTSARAGSPGADLEDVVRANTLSQWHMVGSCRMGLDTLSVVDPQLRVHGIDGLRVVDGSVLPRVVSGNSQAAILMIAERAAEFITRNHYAETASSAAHVGGTARAMRTV
jgi:choline dehydrogenase